MINFENLKRLIFILFIITFNLAYGQQPLYVIKNNGLLNFQFSYLDPASDSLGVISTAPFNYFAMHFNSSYDSKNSIYYYSNGQIIFKVNTTTGLAEDTMDFSNFHPSFFDNLQFNPLDSCIYGIRNDDFHHLSFFYKINPRTKTLTNIKQILPYLVSGLTCTAILDQKNQRYILQSDKLTALDIATGNTLFQHSINTTGNQVFDHIAFSCKTGKIYGLLADPVNTETYFAEVDTSTGNINLVNNQPLPVYFYKDAQSGSTIDNNTDIFYYPSLLGNLYGIDIHTGAISYSHNYGSGFEFLFLESASDFDCMTVDVRDIQATETDYKVFPNPFNNAVSISFNATSTLTIRNSLGQTVLRKIISGQETLQLSYLPPGLYFFEIETGSRHFSRKMIKLGE